MSKLTKFLDYENKNELSEYTEPIEEEIEYTYKYKINGKYYLGMFHTNGTLSRRELTKDEIDE